MYLFFLFILDADWKTSNHSARDLVLCFQSAQLRFQFPAEADPFLYLPHAWKSTQQGKVFRPAKFILLLSNFVETNCILTVSVLRFQTWHLLVFCCSPFTSSVLCIQRWSSAYLSCDQELFELLLPFCHLEPALPRYSSTQLIFPPPLTFIFNL